MDENEVPDAPIIPVVRQPTGARYFFGTWTGRIQILNAVIFAIMVSRDPTAFVAPSEELIRWFGSKSLVEIANGEWWRFVTPVFIHIGALHFFFNAMGLYYIGYQIEHILGARWFLVVYFLSGITGNLASCLASVQFSAGASGAIFGLLGAGFKLEGLVSDAFDRTESKKQPRRRIYTSMALTNIGLGFVIPVIDNAAHIGGLAAGWMVTEMMLRVRPNRLRRQSRAIAAGIALLLGAFSVSAVYLSSDRNWVTSRYYRKAIKAESAREAYFLLSEGLKVLPLDGKSLLFRGKLLLQNGDGAAGIRDVALALKTGKVSAGQVSEVIAELRLTGHNAEAEIVRRLSENADTTDL